MLLQSLHALLYLCYRLFLIMEKLSLYDKILFPVVTEKSTNLSEQNKIIFKVPSSASKKTLKGSQGGGSKPDIDIPRYIKLLSAKKMLFFAFNYFDLDFKNFVLTRKNLIRKKDFTIKHSDPNICLNKNKIKRHSKIYGKKLINLLAA